MHTDGLAQRLTERLARGRAAAEARMTSRADVYRLEGRTSQNETTGSEAGDWVKVHEDIPFRLSSGNSQTIVIGGATFEEATGIGNFTAATKDLEDGDLIEVISGEWPGSVLRIVAAIRADQDTARRVPIVEEPRPEEWL